VFVSFRLHVCRIAKYSSSQVTVLHVRLAGVCPAVTLSPSPEPPNSMHRSNFSLFMAAAACVGASVPDLMRTCVIVGIGVSDLPFSAQGPNMSLPVTAVKYIITCTCVCFVSAACVPQREIQLIASDGLARTSGRCLSRGDSQSVPRTSKFDAHVKFLFVHGSCSLYWCIRCRPNAHLHACVVACKQRCDLPFSAQYPNRIIIYSSLTTDHRCLSGELVNCCCCALTPAICYAYIACHVIMGHTSHKMGCR